MLQLLTSGLVRGCRDDVGVVCVCGARCVCVCGTRRASVPCVAVRCHVWCGVMACVRPVQRRALTCALGNAVLCDICFVFSLSLCSGPSSSVGMQHNSIPRTRGSLLTFSFSFLPTCELARDPTALRAGCTRAHFPGVYQSKLSCVSCAGCVLLL